MDSLGGDESLAWVVSACGAGLAGIRLAHVLWPVSPMRNARCRLALAVVPALALLGLHAVLLGWAAREVRGSAEYLVLFDAAGALWLALVWMAMPLTGLSPRDDAVEAENPAATVAVCGAWIGALGCYAGANVGEGPTIWTTFGPAALATAVWLGLWLGLELLVRPVEAIAIDRDPATAARLAALLVANGAVLGAGAAGDWVSVENTVRSILHAAVPAVGLTFLAAWAQRRWRPTPDRPVGALLVQGVLPGAALLVLAAVGVALRGAW